MCAYVINILAVLIIFHVILQTVINLIILENRESQVENIPKTWTTKMYRSPK